MQLAFVHFNKLMNIPTKLSKEFKVSAGIIEKYFNKIVAKNKASNYFMMDEGITEDAEKKMRRILRYVEKNNCTIGMAYKMIIIIQSS